MTENSLKDKSSFEPPVFFLLLVILVSIGPFILNQLGIDFESEKFAFQAEATAGMSPIEVVDGMFKTLGGAFLHTILEWSAFCAAFFTVILSFAYFSIKRDVGSPILGVALFCAGCMDAFHTLAADRLIQAVADNRNLVPFTWAICRLFNALILIIGISLLNFGKYKRGRGQIFLVIWVSLVFGLLAYGVIYYCATSGNLPNTMFPDYFVTRPWDIAPLGLYLFAGIYVFPRYYRKERNFISYSLMVSVIPHIATQLHMAFGSFSLFDNHFNIGHFLKIIAYVIPFVGFILEYIKTNHEQQVSEAKTRTVIESAQEGIIVIDIKGVVSVFNAFAEKIFGYSRAEVIGKNVRMLMPEPYSSEHDEYLSKYLNTGKKNIIGIIRELEGRRKDATVFPIELGVNEMELGKEKLYVGSIRDISERKASEKKLLTAKRIAEVSREEAEHSNRAKSIFLANMSHEIRTPMNAILGYSQILLRRRDLEPDVRQALTTIDNSGKNLLDMINEILDISKIEAGKLELNQLNFDLHDLAKGVSKMFELRCAQKKISWKVEGLEESCHVFGDGNKLRAILINLIGNAVKFTESGEIIFKINTLGNDQFLFEVADTGAGIALKDQKNIFDPFTQEESGAKKGGTGLGLAISSKQLKLMKSELKLESEIGKGSRFYFTLVLPKATEEVPKRIERTHNILSLTKECRVKALVADDIKENRDVLSAFLTGLNVEVVQAVDGKDALDKVRKYLPDIIFMDIRMPVMSGDQAILEIQKEFGANKFKIVVISASVFENKKESFIKMGAHGFVTKPFRAEHIINCLDELLDVEFEYDSNEILDEKFSATEEIDYSRISLSSDLYSMFDDAVQLNNITQLDAVVNSLLEMDENCIQLGTKIRGLLKQFDMDSIMEINEKLKNERQ